MSTQQDVSAQNARTLEKIQDTLFEFRARSPRLEWLHQVLNARGLDPKSGGLVAVKETPEQEGQHFRGVWATTSRSFWSFVVVASRDYRTVLTVEEFDDVTAQTVVSEHVPGTGKSFGYLALQALGHRAEV